MKPYQVIKALREKQVIELCGSKFRMIPGEIKPGDWYIAERNTGPHLLVCDSISPGYDSRGGWINPTSLDYNFDINECVRVEEV